MKSNLYIVPDRYRYFLKDSTGKIFGSKTGYSTYVKASAARNFLPNAQSALIARYKNYDHATRKHWKSL